MMNELQQLTKDQLYNKLKNRSENFNATVCTALENTLFDEHSLSDEDLSEFLQMLDEETVEKIKEASTEVNDEEDYPNIVLAESKSITTSLDVTTQNGEGYKIVLIEHDINLSGNLFIEEYIVLIITGNIKAKNIIVNGSLYCSGNVTCNVLFGASSNDNETHIERNISSVLIAENGHYTVAKGNIHSKYLISFHNEIEGKSGRFIENPSLEVADDIKQLNPEMIDEDGYFDEDAFLNLINIHPVETLFK
ncbi:polymer-forming cytoskeletal protein [Chryseobacterium aurantiacum]|uniref:polymer-forming cytoskeletal protein n=1 Tax=Chryseobacterium aurantiacum TaxID=2116499 RepID=UPI0013C49D40|nr:polymer-forming cytoskeletal protein [Chryseobacterium aurantiacum]